MASVKDITGHKLDQKFKGERLQASPLPPMEMASASNPVPANRIQQSLKWMLPDNARRRSQEMADNASRRFDWRHNQEHRETYSRLIRQSFEDRQKRKELAQYREFEILSDLFAIPFAMAPFQAINLSADELPLLLFPKARQYFTVRYLGNDGGARQDQWRQTKDVEQHEMRTISTDKVEFPLVDIQQGNVNEMSTIQDQLRFDMEMQLDKEAQDVIDGLETDSGLRALLNLHPLINTANIPDRNHLDLSDGTQELTIGKWKSILDHVASFGQGVDPDRSLTISSVIMSPQNLRDQWDFVDLVSGFSGAGTVQPDTDEIILTSTREEIFNTGMMNSAWGFSWTSMANARLAKGRMYVFMNQPVGWFFTKTELDRLIIWDGPDEVAENYGQIVWRRVYQFVTPDLWKHRILIVDL